MFPLRFPKGVLEGRAEPGDVVLDPFCGRGTTNYASRLLGLPTLGVDSNPVAVALSQAKLANVTPDEIVAEAERILSERHCPARMPRGDFWDLAYHPEVLDAVCRLREGLLSDALRDVGVALRAVVLGALHGPQPKVQAPTYLSNQCQRTYAPKPRYAVKFWRNKGMVPKQVDVLDVIKMRAVRYYGSESSVGRGAIRLGTAAMQHACGV